MTDLLEKVKEAGQDHEFYLTSKRMLEAVAKDICQEFDDSYTDHLRNFSILDIGAGNGSALNIMCELTRNDGKKYAIEKSKILIDSLPEDVFIIGTDFHQQTLIDKQVDVVFCNPPYSEFDTWMRRIVSEANCRIVYMVVPQRWKENRKIVEMINRRCDLKDDDQDMQGESKLKKRIREEYRKQQGECKVLLSDTFLDSEFRKARANVDILKIKFRDNGYRAVKLAVDPFDIWFEENFSISADKDKKEVVEKETKEEKLHNLVKGQNIIERLEELYHADMAKLFTTYKALEQLDSSLFKELGVDLKQVKGGLSFKIEGLKNLYWKELFTNLDSITNRLTSKSREKLLATLTEHTSVDFTSANAYAVVIWAVKNANKYFDKQLLEVYFELAETENIRNYKSNKVVLTDKWRYAAREHTHYTLDYRLVLMRGNCFGGYSYDHPNGLQVEVHTLLGDLCTVAKNLGFDVETTSMDLQWEPGLLNEFRMADGTLFMDVRAYKKGTIHVRLNQEFMKKLNIEAGRLNGWVKSPSEAKEETGIVEANELFGSNYKMKSIRLLSAS